MKKIVVMLSGALTFLGLNAYTPLPGSFTNIPGKESYTNDVLRVTNNTQNPVTVWTTGYHTTAGRTEIPAHETKTIIEATIDPNIPFDFLFPGEVTVTLHVASDGREVTKDITRNYDVHRAIFYRDRFAFGVGELSNGELKILEEKPNASLQPAWSPKQTEAGPEGAQIHYPEK
ncbi:hypothetical protein KJZ61_02450 [Candidatus Dependentiae bacterium]|nr:hypothetical protein [Candidatus Dependentiae bacterium]